MERLKPCPFCGADVCLDKAYNIKAWNRRAAYERLCQL